MNVPPCPARRELPGESRTFFCADPRMAAPGNLVTSEICRVCTLCRGPPPDTYRPFPPAADAPKPRGWCAHLGAEIGLRECPACGGNVRVKVFACNHPNHVETTATACQSCPDFNDRATR